METAVYPYGCSMSANLNEPFATPTKLHKRLLVKNDGSHFGTGNFVNFDVVMCSQGCNIKQLLLSFFLPDVL